VECRPKSEPTWPRTLEARVSMRVRRVPMALRGAQQRITPDVQIGCISCASGDGKFGAPIWWNTPLEEDDVPDAAAEQHRAQWGQEVTNLLSVISTLLGLT
jgi:hypothetical protein